MLIIIVALYTRAGALLGNHLWYNMDVRLAGVWSFTAADGRVVLPCLRPR